MKKIVILLLLCYPIISHAQSKGFASSKDREEIEVSALSGTLNAYFAFEADDRTIKSVDADAMFKAVTDTMVRKPACLPYKDNISKFYNGIKGAGKEYPIPEFLKGSNCIPTYVQYKDGYALIFPPLFYGTTFNTLQLNEKERASRAINTVAMPIISGTAETMTSNIRYIGVAVCYGKKNFSDKYALNQGEYVLIIAPVSIMKDFAFAYITDSELIEKADIYLYDSYLKKIKID